MNLRSISEPQQPRVEVRRSVRRRRTVTAYRERDAIVVLIPQSMSRADERRFVDDLVRKVLARESRVSAPRRDPELAERACALADRYLAPALEGFPEPRSVTWVTNQQQRWGSCTEHEDDPPRIGCKSCRRGWWTMCSSTNWSTWWSSLIRRGSGTWSDATRLPRRPKGLSRGVSCRARRAGPEIEDVD